MTISCTTVTSNANWQESNDYTITTEVGISSLLAAVKIHGSDTSEVDVPSHPGLNPVTTLSQGTQLANLFSSYSLLSTRASSGGKWLTVIEHHANRLVGGQPVGRWPTIFEMDIDLRLE